MDSPFSSMPGSLSLPSAGSSNASARQPLLDVPPCTAAPNTPARKPLLDVPLSASRALIVHTPISKKPLSGEEATVKPATRVARVDDRGSRRFAVYDAENVFTTNIHPPSPPSPGLHSQSTGQLDDDGEHQYYSFTNIPTSPAVAHHHHHHHHHHEKPLRDPAEVIADATALDEAKRYHLQQLRIIATHADDLLAESREARTRASHRLESALLAKKRADSVIATKTARLARAQARLARAKANMHRLLTPEELAGFEAYRLLNSKAKPTAPAALRGRSAHWMKDAITGPVSSRRDKLSVGGADDVVPIAAQIGGGL